MAFRLEDVQAALAEGLDGWLLYDFRAAIPSRRASRASTAGGQSGDPAVVLPRAGDGQPRGLVHAIERHNLDHLPGPKSVYAGRVQLEAELKTLLSGMSRVAMEYSPGNAIPYVSRVDAGTVEMVRDAGVDRGDQQRGSGPALRWALGRPAIASHQEASDKLHRIKDRAFDAVARRLREGTPTTEFDIQQQMVQWFAEEGLVAGSAPNVSPRRTRATHTTCRWQTHRAIGPDELVLLDLWGKVKQPGAVYADITWVCYTGPVVPDEQAHAFDAVARPGTRRWR